MSDRDLDSASLAADNGHTASDVESCLVLVTSYIGAVSLGEKVTTEANGRLVMSPSLGDFIKLRYAHIGDQPSEGGQSAAARITDHLLQPRPGIGRNYFAAVILDRSAATVEAVLQDCVASPFLSALPIRLLGIASREDRRVPRPPRGAQIRVSPVGSWQRHELVDELLRYADALMRDFAGGRQRGLTPDELTRYRDQFVSHVAREGAAMPSAAVPGTGSSAALPDALGEEPGPTAAPTETLQFSPGSVESGPAEPQRPVRHDGPDQGAAEPMAPRTLSGLVRRLVPGRGRQRGGQPDAQPSRLPAQARGLAYLVLTGDQDAGDPAEWNRSRALVLELDQRLAALPGLSVDLRVPQGDDMELRGDLRAAGQLTKRDVRGAVADLYLATVLDQIQLMLTRDAARPSSGLPLARPAVMFIAPVPPMADSAAVASLRRLAGDASVAWVVPKSRADLMAQEFIDAGQLITDFTVAADDLAALFPVFGTPDAGDVEVEVDDATHDGDGESHLPFKIQNPYPERTRGLTEKLS
ncbi:MAG: hypothetical protein ABSA02_06285 [Trebonia sp.]